MAQPTTASDSFDDPATGRNDPAVTDPAVIDPSSRNEPAASDAETIIEGLHDSVLRETARTRLELDWLVTAWNSAGRQVSARLVDWKASKDLTVVGVVADLIFFFLLESPAVRDAIAGMLRSASGWLGRLVLKRRVALNRIEDLSAAIEQEVAQENSSLVRRVTAAREAEALARSRLEDMVLLADVGGASSAPRRGTAPIPDRTPRFDFGASNQPDRQRQVLQLTFQHVGTMVDLNLAIAQANAELAKEFEQTAKKIKLAESVKVMIDAPRTLENALAASKTAYKVVDPTGYDATSQDPPAGTIDLDVDVQLLDAMNVLAIRLKHELDAIDRAADKLLRAGLRADAERFATSCLGLVKLQLNVMAMSVSTRTESAGTITGSSALDEARPELIKRLEEVIWAWLLYKPYFAPEENEALQRYQYDPTWVKGRSSGDDWPPPDAALEYLYGRFLAKADDSWLDEGLDMIERAARAFHSLQILLSPLAPQLLVPDSTVAKEKTGREVEIIIHFRKIRNVSMATLLPS